jgi:transposase
LAVERVVNKYSMKEHLILNIKECFFEYVLNQESLAKEKMLDGVYAIRTSFPVEVMSSAECLRQNKNLWQAEKAFLIMKSFDLRSRKISHNLDKRIESHLLLTMLAYYVEAPKKCLEGTNFKRSRL